MRFLLKEQPYEKRIAAGTLRYERDGQPTGALEHWRYTHALDGYKFLRVDLDGRESSGDTFLYTVLLNSDGRLEDLRWRFYNAAFHAGGQVLFDGRHATAVREVEDSHFEEETELVDGVAFFFPAVLGLWLLKDKQLHTAVTLDMHNREPADFMKMVSFPAELKHIDTALNLEWVRQDRQLDFGKHGWPIHMARPDGLTAVEQRIAVYG